MPIYSEAETFVTSTGRENENRPVIVVVTCPAVVHAVKSVVMQEVMRALSAVSLNEVALHWGDCRGSAGHEHGSCCRGDWRQR